MGGAYGASNEIIMLYGLFYMIDSLRGKHGPEKTVAEKLLYRMAGAKDRMKAEHEVARLEQQNPRYKLSEQLKSK